MKMNFPVRAANHDLVQTEAAQAFWTHYAPDDATRESVLKPDYWANVTHKLQPLSEIRIIAKDSSWYARYLVMRVDGQAAKVVELEFHKLEDVSASETETAQHKVEWKGPALKFCVTRTSDGKRIQEGLSKEEATKWMHDHEKQMAA